MRRADEHSHRLRPVSLYRDELEQLAKIASAGSVEYRSEGLVYDSLEDLSHGRSSPLRTLVIQPIGNTDGAAAVTIQPHQVEVFKLSASSERADQAVALLRRCARGAQPVWWRVLYLVLAWLVSIMAAGLVFRYGSLPPITLVMLGAFAAIVFSAVLTSAQNALGQSAVFLNYRGESKRDRPSMIAVVIALLSGLVGFLIGIGVS